ncbi:MAG: hypothetical protein MZW92_04610 [Comamonadaceae bacterium]|nr:hypothetical protein [Comamonadaceae bacterium]
MLMVEDNPVNMMIAVAHARAAGARASAQAERRPRRRWTRCTRAAAAGRPFDAVLMDVQMPVMSGHEATRVLRASVPGAEPADHRAHRRGAGDRARRRRWPPA